MIVSSNDSRSYSSQLSTYISLSQTDSLTHDMNTSRYKQALVPPVRPDWYISDLMLLLTRVPHARSAGYTACLSRPLRRLAAVALCDTLLLGSTEPRHSSTMCLSMGYHLSPARPCLHACEEAHQRVRLHVI